MDRRVAILGTGSIGTGWAAAFAAGGWRVRLFDADQSRANATLQAVAGAVAAVRRLADLSRPVGSWTWTSSIEEALAGAAFVQESVPDLLEVKRPLLEEVSTRLAPHVPIASSTSAFRPSQLQEGVPQPQRILVGHPFHPVQLMPLIEVVGAPQTSDAILTHSVQVYEDIGKTVIRLKSETTGHLVNRLQAAMIREAVHLVSTGVATVHDVDRGLAYAPALRWPLAGVFMTLHLAGGAGGGREYLAKLGPSLELMWDDLGNPRLSPDVRELLAKQLELHYGDRSLADLTAERDLLLRHLVAELKQSGRLV